MRKGNKVFGSGHNKGLGSSGRNPTRYRDSPENEALLTNLAIKLGMKKSEIIRECLEKSIEGVAVENGLSFLEFAELRAQSLMTATNAE